MQVRGSGGGMSSQHGSKSPVLIPQVQPVASDNEHYSSKEEIDIITDLHEENIANKAKYHDAAQPKHPAARNSQTPIPVA